MKTDLKSSVTEEILDFYYPNRAWHFLLIPSGAQQREGALKNAFASANGNPCKTEPFLIICIDANTVPESQMNSALLIMVKVCYQITIIHSEGKYLRSL